MKMLSVVLTIMLATTLTLAQSTTPCPQLPGPPAACQTLTIDGTAYLSPLYTVPTPPSPPPPNGLPVPPASATVFGNLQKASGWLQCAGPGCAGGDSGGSGSLTQGIATPSLSGASMKQTATGKGYNVMYYNHLGCAQLPGKTCTGVSNFLLDFQFYVDPTATAIQALEFDPQLYLGGYKYSQSAQCENVNKVWRLWNQSTDGWTTTAYPCTVATATGVWHRYQVYVTVNAAAHTYSFQTLVLDGVTVFANANHTFTATNKGWSDNIGVQEQIDNNSAAQTNTVYYDQYSLTAW
jgi:hypothetical protein